VVEDPWWTIQGEGPFAGRPSVFVRLAGCNLQCPNCDTDYTSTRKKMSPAELVHLIQTTIPLTVFRPPLIVLTGGEPFRQNLLPLFTMLDKRGYEVQVETNGTLAPAGGLNHLPVHIVCSPKAGAVNPYLRPHIQDLKYVLSADAIDPGDGLPTSVLGNKVSPARPWPGFSGEIWVQPEDSYNIVDNTDACRDVAMKFGYRMTVQVHKLIGVK